MIPIETSWRLRPVFRVLIGAAIVVPSAIAVLAANGQRKWDYNVISSEFEEPELPPEFVGNMQGSTSVRADGLRQVEWGGGWVYFGPCERERESGRWTILDPEGHDRGRFTMRDNERDGPCEFWDTSGRRRVSGSYKRAQRAGLWTLDNVLGDGRKYVMYRPAWSLP